MLRVRTRLQFDCSWEIVNDCACSGRLRRFHWVVLSDEVNARSFFLFTSLRLSFHSYHHHSYYILLAYYKLFLCVSHASIPLTLFMMSICRCVSVLFCCRWWRFIQTAFYLKKNNYYLLFGCHGFKHNWNIANTKNPCHISMLPWNKGNGNVESMKLEKRRSEIGTKWRKEETKRKNRISQWRQTKRWPFWWHSEPFSLFHVYIDCVWCVWVWEYDATHSRCYDHAFRYRAPPAQRPSLTVR